MSKHKGRKKRKQERKQKSKQSSVFSELDKLARNYAKALALHPINPLGKYSGETFIDSKGRIGCICFGYAKPCYCSECKHNQRPEAENPHPDVKWVGCHNKQTIRYTLTDTKEMVKNDYQS